MTRLRLTPVDRLQVADLLQFAQTELLQIARYTELMGEQPAMVELLRQWASRAADLRERIGPEER